jgi:hypothetical protein
MQRDVLILAAAAFTTGYVGLRWLVRKRRGATVERPSQPTTHVTRLSHENEEPRQRRRGFDVYDFLIQFASYR